MAKDLSEVSGMGTGPFMSVSKEAAALALSEVRKFFAPYGVGVNGELVVKESKEAVPEVIVTVRLPKKMTYPPKGRRGK